MNDPRIKNEPPKVKDRPNGLLNHAEEFGPISHGDRKRCNLVAANMATGISALRAVTVSGATYLVQGESLGGFEAFAEEIIGIRKEKSPVNIVFMYGGDVLDALKHLMRGGVLVVIGIAQGQATRPEWMKVRQYGNVLLQRFGAPTMGPDRSGDVGIGVIENIRVEALGLTYPKPPKIFEQIESTPPALPAGVRVDGRKGGHVWHGGRKA